MFCLAPTIRFGDIYFADHYNYIYYSYFLYLSAQRDKLGKLSGYASVCETATIHHMSDLESDPEEVFFSYFALEERRFKRTDTSM